MQKTVKRSPIFRFLTWSCLAVLIVAGLYSLNLFLDVSLTVSKQTTLYSSPVDVNGRVDYLKVYEELHYTSDLTTEKNGFRQVIELVSLGEELKGESLRQVRGKLGLEPDLKTDLLTFKDPMIYVRRFVESEQLDEKLVGELKGGETILDESMENEIDPWRAEELITALSNRPWTEDDLPMMAIWLKQHAKVLDIYADAVRQPVFELPFCNADAEYGMMLEVNLYSQHFRSIARGYMVRANYFLGKGETRKALDDIISCRLLGRHLRNQGGMIQRMVGIAIESIAASAGIVDVESPSLSREDLDYFETNWNSVPPLSNLEHVILYEKLVWLDALQLMSKRSTGDLGKLLAGRESPILFLLGINWDVAAREFHNEFDNAWKNRNWDSLERQASIWDLAFRHTRSQLVGRWFAGRTVGHAFIEAERRTLCTQHLKQITLAMLKYEQDHGCLPPAYTEDKNGKRLHSWRVLLLPYLGQSELYEQINLEEPWDSEHNSALHNQCPAVFACPSCTKCQNGHTSYAVVVGDGLAFQGPVGCPLDKFGKDSNDLILVVERMEPVNWLNPNREIPFEKIRFDEPEGRINYQPASNWDPKTGTEIPVKVYPDRIGSRHPAGAQFGMRNGSVWFISETHDPKVFKDRLRGINSVIQND